MPTRPFRQAANNIWFIVRLPNLVSNVIVSRAGGHGEPVEPLSGGFDSDKLAPENA